MIKINSAFSCGEHLTKATGSSTTISTNDDIDDVVDGTFLERLLSTPLQ